MKKLFKENDLVKFVTLAILVTLILTWIIPGGSFAGTDYTKAEITRVGLSQLSISGVYGVSFFLQQIVFVLVIGAFYGVISKTNGYKELITKCAKFIKGKEILTVLIVSALIALFVSFSSQVFVTFVFVPFIVTVLLRAKLDKKTAFAATFGSIFIGLIGASYGTEGLYYFNYYMGTDLTTAVKMRFVVLGIAYVLFNFFNVKHAKKVLSKKALDESKEDLFAVEASSKRKVKVWPIALLLIVTLIFAVLGYIRWEEQFKIKCFSEFHTWLIGLKVGKHAIISYLLGSTATAFGTWELYSIFLVLLIVMVIACIIYKIKLDDIIDGASEGIAKMVKPAVLMVLAYSIFVIIYWSPIMPTINSWILSNKFNPFLATISGFISSVFTADFGFTGYSIGSFLTTAYASNLKEVFVIYPAMHGFAQMIAPTSVILLAGLSYMGISYKEYVKHIAKFATALFVALLVVFAILTYM